MFKIFSVEDFYSSYVFFEFNFCSLVQVDKIKLKELEKFLISLEQNERDNCFDLLFSQQKVNVELALAIANSDLDPEKIIDLFWVYQQKIRGKSIDFSLLHSRRKKSIDHTLKDVVK